MIQGAWRKFLTFSNLCILGCSCSWLAQRRTQAGMWLCTPGAAFPLPCSPSRVLRHTAEAFLQLLFVGSPSILVADFIFAPREQNRFHFAPLFAGGARAFLWKDYLSFMIHPFWSFLRHTAEWALNFDVARIEPFGLSHQSYLTSLEFLSPGSRKQCFQWPFHFTPDYRHINGLLSLSHLFWG